MSGFAVAANGSSVNSATGPQSLLNFKYPMSKLDTTNQTSFQTISILFNHEPTNPSGSTFVVETPLYQYPHGYTYIPALWMIWQNSSPAFPAPPGAGATATTFPPFGDDSAAYNGILGTATQLSPYAVVAYNDPGFGYTANFSDAFLYVYADATNVNIICRKVANAATSGGSLVPVYVIGTTVNLRIYNFVEPANSSIY